MEGEIGNKKMIIDIAQLQYRLAPKKQQIFEVKLHKVDKVTDVDSDADAEKKKILKNRLYLRINENHLLI